MKILFIGDVVGSPGRRIILDELPSYRTDNNIDFVVCNGENAAAGSGITPKILGSLRHHGCDVITSGDHTFRNKEVFKMLGESRFVRPANFSTKAGGQGYTIVEHEDKRIAVISLIGRIFMNPADCPFQKADEILAEIKGKADIILVDMHAEATSEKIAMAYHLDGRVQAVVGTHTHVQTSDARLLPQGTATQTDLGMTGARHGIIGRKVQPVLHKFITDMPSRFDVAEEDVCLEGALLTLDENLKAESLIPIRFEAKHPVENP